MAANICHFYQIWEFWNIKMIITTVFECIFKIPRVESKIFVINCGFHKNNEFARGKSYPQDIQRFRYFSVQITQQSNTKESYQTDSRLQNLLESHGKVNENWIFHKK